MAPQCCTFERERSSLLWQDATMHTDVIADLTAWTGNEVAADRSWEFHLSDAEVSALERALRTVADRPLVEIGAQDFVIDDLAPTLDAIRHQLRAGRGFAVLKGFPVDQPLPDLERLYWGLLAHVGNGVTQNSDASLIHYVTDGRLRPNQGGRGVGNPGKSGLHVDLADYVSLLCVRQAKDNPPSWLGSATFAHNHLLEHEPELLEVLYRGFEWDRLGEEGSHDGPTTGYRVPVFSAAEGLVSCRYNRFWMAAAVKRSGGGWSTEERAALDALDAVLHANRLDVDFVEGDIQFVNNYVVLHGRDAHALEDDEDHKRLLMRIWVNDDEQPRPVADEAVVRHGVLRHGNLGWKLPEVRAGLVGTARTRRSDGAVLV